MDVGFIKELNLHTLEDVRLFVRTARLVETHAKNKSPKVIDHIIKLEKCRKESITYLQELIKNGHIPREDGRKAIRFLNEKFEEVKELVKQHCFPENS